MKIQSIQELKEFILWAKKEKLNAVKIGEIEFNFSHLAFIPKESYEFEDIPRLDKESINDNYPLPKTNLEVNGEEVDEDLLYYSSS